jgi:hypothetical protein
MKECWDRSGPVRVGKPRWSLLNVAKNRQNESHAKALRRNEKKAMSEEFVA